MITQYVLRNKNLTPLLLMILCTCCALTTSVHAEAVHIPDPNLRSAIADALNIAPGAVITQNNMKQLMDLSVYNRGIQNLIGLEYATNLSVLFIDANRTITDLSPLTGLKLKHLGMFGIPGIDITPLSTLSTLQSLDAAACDLIDIRPLTRLTQLTSLNLRANQIVDIKPLSNLTSLQKLRLNSNRITDITPLQNLTHLTFLEIQHNQITDYSPLDALPLSHFVYDQYCDMPPLPLEPRLENRLYPSIYAQWSGFGWLPIRNRPELSPAENIALHDLRFSVGVFGLDFHQGINEFHMSGNIAEAIRLRDLLLRINPNMITLFDVGMRAAPLTFFPDDSPYWIRDAQGNIHEGLLDFTHPAVQDRIVQQAIAVAKCGLYDGIFFDFWSEEWTVLDGFRTMAEEQYARDVIVRRIRANTRPNFLIMGNTNDAIIPRTAPYINGGFMEAVLPFNQTGNQLEASLTRLENSLRWMENNLREPRINALEGSAIPTEPPDSPDNLRWMRVFTTMSLTHSDGYVLFQFGSNHDHYWYDFWDADLGHPLSEEKAQVYEDRGGLYIREFTNGWAVYNHSGETQVITLPEEVQGVASGLVNTEHAVPNLDGEMYLRVKPPNPADVNRDGAVNILDLTLVAQAFGTDKPEGDVNGDGVVNVFDLVFVAGKMQ